MIFLLDRNQIISHSLNKSEIHPALSEIAKFISLSIVLKQEQACRETTEAKIAELQELKQFNTYEEVKNCGQYSLSTRWVITKKEAKTKARLVVICFEEEFIMQRDSPTVGKGTMRIFLAIVACKNWTVKTTDIRSAFLQGKELRRDVHIKSPKESKTNKDVVWKLKHV